MSFVRGIAALWRRLRTDTRLVNAGITRSANRLNELIDLMIEARKQGDYGQAHRCEDEAIAELEGMTACRLKWQLQIRLWRDGAEWRRRLAGTLPLGSKRNRLLREALDNLSHAANQVQRGFKLKSRAGRADLGASLGMKARLMVTQGEPEKAFAELNQVRKLLFWGNNPRYRLYHGLDYTEVGLYLSDGRPWRLWPALLADLLRAVVYGQHWPPLHALRAGYHIVLALLPRNQRGTIMEGLLPPEHEQQLTQLLAADVDVLLQGLALSLKELARGERLPSNIYVCGGGSLLPEVMTELRKNAWAEGLPFAREPRARQLTPTDIRALEDSTGQRTTPQDVAPMGLGVHALRQGSEDRDFVNSVMHGVLKAMKA